MGELGLLLFNDIIDLVIGKFFYARKKQKKYTCTQNMPQIITEYATKDKKKNYAQNNVSRMPVVYAPSLLCTNSKSQRQHTDLFEFERAQRAFINKDVDSRNLI